MKRVKITIEGPHGSGKTFIRKHIESLLTQEGRSYKTYDPVYKFKPDQIDFGDAQVIIMVKTKSMKPVHASDCQSVC